MANLRILIIANDPLARTGLATLVSGQPDCTVTGQVAATANLNEAIQVYRPDIVLWDMGTAARADLEPLAQLSRQAVVVALVGDEEDAARVWPAGVQGLVSRDADAAHIAAALRAASEHLVVIDPPLMASLAPIRNELATLPLEPLSPREQQVLELMAQGRPNKEIARQLGISEHTVKFHVNSIFARLHVSSRTEAVVQATRSGLVLL